MHTDFECIVRNTITKYRMLEKTKRIAVGFSGGADSVSLLYFLYKFVKESNKAIELIPIHVNHELRGEESKRDEIFVKEFCDDLGLPVIIVHRNIKELANKHKISVEEAGRNARYQVFDEYASEENSKIAVAHTLSDNCETTLFNLTRGTSLKGLCGIPPIRGNIIRPLIKVTRSQIENYCKKNGLKYVNDSTNFMRDYTRNKIRLDVIPELKSINPNFEFAMSRLITMLRENEEFIDDVAQKILDNCRINHGYSIANITRESHAIKSRITYKILSEHFSKPIENKHVLELLDIMERGSGVINVCDTLSIKCENDKLVMKEIPKNVYNFWELKMNIGKNFLPNSNDTVVVSVITSEQFTKINKKGVAAIDFEKLSEECHFRCRKSGDKFKFQNRAITKSIKKIFNELKIPVEKRSTIPILVSGKNVVWIKNVGVSKDYAPTCNTKKVLILELEHTY